MMLVPTVSPSAQLLRSSVGRKLLVGAAGALLALFVLAHTLGNLQIFLGPDAINRYAATLKTLPYGLLWVFRAAVVAAVAAHVGLAARLHARNRRARGRGYAQERYLAAGRASRSMMLAGAGILLFLIWHILHFTTRSVVDFSMLAPYRLPDLPEPVMDVHAMIIVGFAHPLVAGVYVAATALVGLHLSHGVASLFQSLGWRSAAWRLRLERLALGCGLFVFLSLALIPLAVLAHVWLGAPIFDDARFAHLLPGR